MNYDPIAAVVTQTIKQYGQSIKVIKLSGKSTNTYGVWGKIIQKETNDQMMGNITKKTQIMYIPSIRIIPEVGDTAIANGVTYSINGVQAYQPTNNAVGYKLELIA